jgi:ABC-type Fe3+-hydroxamate transport system substrate-binding protein
MKTLCALSLLLVLAAGCQSPAGPAPSEPAAPAAAAAKSVPSPSPFSKYHEIVHDGRIYVLGSKSSAEALAAGQKPVLHVSRIGYGPNRETVIFEANKDGNLEKWLMAEYLERHPRP